MLTRPAQTDRRVARHLGFQEVPGVQSESARFKFSLVGSADVEWTYTASREFAYTVEAVERSEREDERGAE